MVFPHGPQIKRRHVVVMPSNPDGTHCAAANANCCSHIATAEAGAALWWDTIKCDILLWPLCRQGSLGAWPPETGPIVNNQ